MTSRLETSNSFAALCEAGAAFAVNSNQFVSALVCYEKNVTPIGVDPSETTQRCLAA
jgi:hypothetical protein